MEPHRLGRARTLAEQAAEEIRNRIVNGPLRLGEALSETAVAAELGISKTPVREAFLLLRTEGLVDIQPQRGTFVFRMDAADARKLSEFREALEVAALRLAIANDTKGLGRRLSAIVGEMGVALADRGNPEYRNLDARFHQQIIDDADNGYLSRAYAAVAFRIQALRYRLRATADLDARSLKHHHRLATLVGRGQRDRAVELLREHIRRTLDDYANTLALEQSGELGAPPTRPPRGRRARSRRSRS